MYSPEDAALHTSSSQMTWCELFAVYAALATYCSVLRNSCVVFYVDNKTDVVILNRQRTRSRRLAGLLRGIYTISVNYNISIDAQWRPGVDNVLADFLSRPSLQHSAHSGSVLAVRAGSPIAAHASSLSPSEIIAAWHTFPASRDFSHPLLSVSTVFSRQFGGRAIRP